MNSTIILRISLHLYYRIKIICSYCQDLCFPPTHTQLGKFAFSLQTFLPLFGAFGKSSSFSSESHAHQSSQVTQRQKKWEKESARIRRRIYCKFYQLDVFLFPHSLTCWQMAHRLFIYLTIHSYAHAHIAFSIAVKTAIDKMHSLAAYCNHNYPRSKLKRETKY